MNGTIVIQEHIPLYEKTTFRTGGQARYYTDVETIEGVSEAVVFAQEKHLSVFILGGGSNILMSDEGFPGLVIHSALSEIVYEDNNDNTVHVRAGSGVIWDELVADTVSRELYGLENLSFIPGTVGASPIQNIGAYGQEVSHVIESVQTVNVTTGKQKVFMHNECHFGYRDSFFKTEAGKEYFVTSVTFKLLKTGPCNITYKDVEEYFTTHAVEPTLENVRKAIIEIRQHKLPSIFHVGTAGSFFKNPIILRTQYERLKKKFPLLPCYEVDNTHVKIPLAWILDTILHMKGVREGNVGLYKTQPLAVVNHGEATTEEIISFAKKIKQKVFDACKIKIECEVQNIF